MDLFNFIESQVGNEFFLLGLFYMLIVSLTKIVYDNNQKGQSTKIADLVLLFSMVLILLFVFIFGHPFSIFFKSFVALSCTRFWYTGLKYIEKLYMYILDYIYREM